MIIFEIIQMIQNITVQSYTAMKCVHGKTGKDTFSRNQEMRGVNKQLVVDNLSFIPRYIFVM